MTLTFVASLSATALFLGMLTFFEAGRYVGKVRLKRDPDGAATGAGPAEAAVFGLLVTCRHSSDHRLLENDLRWRSG